MKWPRRKTKPEAAKPNPRAATQGAPPTTPAMDGVRRDAPPVVIDLGGGAPGSGPRPDRREQPRRATVPPAAKPRPPDAKDDDS